VSEEEVLVVFTRILRDLLMDDSIVLKMGTRRQEVPNWDSMAYISFVVAAEGELGLKFRLAEVDSFETVGDIVAAVRTRLR
jgi:acyl carrier protein